MLRRPTPLRELVGRLLEAKTDPHSERMRGVQGRVTVEVFRAFEGIGPPLTDHAEPASFRRGRLTLRVRSSAWMTELGMMQAKLIQRINGSLGRPRVREVRLVLGGAKPRVPPRRPPEDRLTARQRTLVATWASSVSNERVREALERAAARSLLSGPAPTAPYSGPPGPRVINLPDPPEAPSEVLTYGFGDRSVDRWRLRRKKDEDG